MRVGVFGSYGKALMVALAMQELGREIGRTVPRQPNVIVFEDCDYSALRGLDAMQVEESPHPGERHRQAVNRVNSKRSRAGKAARWS